MKRDDVKIGCEYLTKIGKGLARVRVLSFVEVPSVQTRSGVKVFFSVVRIPIAPNTRPIRRSAAALREAPLPLPPKMPRDLSGDPGHDAAERRDSPPPVDALIMAGGLPIGAGDPGFLPGPFEFGDAQPGLDEGD